MTDADGLVLLENLLFRCVREGFWGCELSRFLNFETFVLESSRESNHSYPKGTLCFNIINLFPQILIFEIESLGVMCVFRCVKFFFFHLFMINVDVSSCSHLLLRVFILLIMGCFFPELITFSFRIFILVCRIAPVEIGMKIVPWKSILRDENCDYLVLDGSPSWDLINDAILNLQSEKRQMLHATF